MMRSAICFWFVLLYSTNCNTRNKNTGIDVGQIFPDSIINQGLTTPPQFLLVGGNTTYCAQASSNQSTYQSFKYVKNFDKRKLNDYYIKAIEGYRKALDTKDCEEDFIYTNRAALRLSFGDYNGALTDYKKLIDLKPDDYRFKLMKGYCHLKLNEIKESESLIDSVITFEENAIRNLQEKRKNSKPARKLGLPPQEIDYSLVASAYFYKGIIEYIEDEKRSACEFWSKSSELISTDPDFDELGIVSEAPSLTVMEKYCK